MKRNHTALQTLIALALLVSASLMFWTPAKASIHHCGFFVLGCHDEEGMCSWLAWNWKWVWTSSYWCDGGSYLVGTFSCSQAYYNDCCTNQEELSCPPIQCPCEPDN